VVQGVELLGTPTSPRLLLFDATLRVYQLGILNHPPGCGTKGENSQRLGGYAKNDPSNSGIKEMG